jgi:hypothetical protein
MVTYYVIFVSLLFNYLTHHLFCLCGIYITSYVTPTMDSLRCPRLDKPDYWNSYLPPFAGHIASYPRRSAHCVGPGITSFGSSPFSFYFLLYFFWNLTVQFIIWTFFNPKIKIVTSYKVDKITDLTIFITWSFYTCTISKFEWI